jgi:DNA-binding transcriptional LysR family regulator
MAKKFLSRLDETLHEIRQDKNEMSGKIRLGTLMGIGKSWLGDQLMDFIEEFPNIALNLDLSGPSQLVKNFERFYLDLIIVPEGHVPHMGEKVHYCDEFITLVYPKDGKGIPPEVFDLLIKNQAPKDLSSLAELPLIVFEHEDPLFIHWCKSFYGQRPSSIHRRLVVNSHGKMLQAVSRGLGIAILPTHVLKRSYYRNQVGTLGPKYEVFHNRFYFVYHKESKELKRMNILRDRLLAFQHNDGELKQ